MSNTPRYLARLSTRARQETGIALMATLMVMVLLSALLVGFTAMVSSEARLGGLDVGSADAFYAAHAGVEKLTSDLGQLFAADFSPSGDAVRAVGNTAPALDGVAWVEPDGSDGYQILFCDDDDNNGLDDEGDACDGNAEPAAQHRTVTSGPYAGFIGLLTEYTVGATARLVNGAEASLERVLQTVSIPVFQFGAFSETDLSYFPGPTFTVGGRIHTNGNLFLSAVNTVTFEDKITVAGEVVRTHMSNGWNTSSIFNGTVRLARGPGVYRNLARTEGSLIDTLGSAENEPTWSNLSTGTYNSYITNGRTGATTLDLPLVTMGAAPIDLVRRPLASEDPDGPIFPQRHFSMASVRILLSDTAADITSLPSTTLAAPVMLDAQAEVGGDPLNPFAGYVVGVNNPPLAQSSANGPQGYRMPLDTTSMGGFIKVEIQTAPGTWLDVTTEILNLGIAGRNLNPGCAEPNLNAVLRIQRLRFDGNIVDDALGTGCGNGSQSPYDYWPNTIYDTREGNLRDNFWTWSTAIPLGGVMHYIELDVNNLRRWLEGSIGNSGTNAMDQNGYILYFSDRRGNRDLGGNETGEYGFEDVINPASGAGTPNVALDTGEDMNGNLSLDTYGQFPTNTLVGATPPLDGAARPTTVITAAEAQVNRAVLFRRALKLTNGTLGNLPMPGLTVTSENPVYVQGDYNASVAAGGFAEPNAASAIVADAVTMLSNNWTDISSFNTPHRPASRVAATTWWRTAVVGGKGPSFPRPGSVSGDAGTFGTDGGVINFLRYLERWTGRTANYRGSIVSFFSHRQGTGSYKCCNNVYHAPIRNYSFDVDFLDPTLLPPGTPMFRDINVMGFTHNVLPGM